MEASGLIGICIVMLVIGIGIAIGVISCLALSLLTSVGMISTSVLVAFWKRRALAGIQALFVQCGLALGAPAGAVLAWGTSHVWPMLSGEWHILIAGAIGGAGGGLAIAWLASAAAGRFAKHTWPWLKGRVTVFHRGDA